MVFVFDGVNVCGYFVWFFFDNFEWVEGYEICFGVIYVDYSNGQKCYFKKSVKYFVLFFESFV